MKNLFCLSALLLMSINSMAESPSNPLQQEANEKMAQVKSMLNNPVRNERAIYLKMAEIDSLLIKSQDKPMDNAFLQKIGELNKEVDQKMPAASKTAALARRGAQESFKFNVCHMAYQVGNTLPGGGMAGFERYADQVNERFNLKSWSTEVELANLLAGYAYLGHDRAPEVKKTAETLIRWCKGNSLPKQSITDERCRQAESISNDPERFIESIQKSRQWIHNAHYVERMQKVHDGYQKEAKKSYEDGASTDKIDAGAAKYVADSDDLLKECGEKSLNGATTAESAPAASKPTLQTANSGATVN